MEPLEGSLRFSSVFLYTFLKSISGKEPNQVLGIFSGPPGLPSALIPFSRTSARSPSALKPGRDHLPAPGVLQWQLSLTSPCHHTQGLGPGLPTEALERREPEKPWNGSRKVYSWQLKSHPITVNSLCLMERATSGLDITERLPAGLSCIVQRITFALEDATSQEQDPVGGVCDKFLSLLATSL